MESIRTLPATDSSGGIGVVETRFERFEEPLELECGDTLSEFTLAWEQYGELNGARDNVVLLFHALTGSHHAAGTNHGVHGLGDAWTDEMVLGWWHDFIGPGRAIDTNRFCVICVNYIGGCYGSTGPLEVNPATGRPWGAVVFPACASRTRSAPRCDCSTGWESTCCTPAWDRRPVAWRCSIWPSCSPNGCGTWWWSRPAWK